MIPSTTPTVRLGDVRCAVVLLGMDTLAALHTIMASADGFEATSVHEAGMCLYHQSRNSPIFCAVWLTGWPGG